MKTYETHVEFVLDLRRYMECSFNFIVPRVKRDEQSVIDICATIRGRTQWVRFPLVLDEHQISFIARCFQ